MYNIDKFVKEKIAIIFNTKDEMRAFQKDCENYSPFIDFCSCFLDRDLDSTYVICWFGDEDLTIKYATNINYFLRHGYDIINVNELIVTIKLPSKDILMEFLEK